MVNFVHNGIYKNKALLVSAYTKNIVCPLNDLADEWTHVHIQNERQTCCTFCYQPLTIVTVIAYN